MFSLIETIYMYLFLESSIILAYLLLCTIILCVIFQLTMFVLKRKQKREEKLGVRHFIWVYIFFIYLAMVYHVTGIGTLWDVQSGFVGRVHLIPFYDLATGGHLIHDILNLLMTIPLGFLLALIWPQFRSAKKIALIGFGFSLMIEVSQLFTIRLFATDDLILNTLGAVFGYLMFKSMYKLLNKNKEKTFFPIQRSTSIFLRNEAVFYLALTFMGVFLFYRPMAVIHLLPAPEIERGIIEFTTIDDIDEETMIELEIEPEELGDIPEDALVVPLSELHDHEFFAQFFEHDNWTLCNLTGDCTEGIMGDVYLENDNLRFNNARSRTFMPFDGDMLYICVTDENNVLLICEVTDLGITSNETGIMASDSNQMLETVIRLADSTTFEIAHNNGSGLSFEPATRSDLEGAIRENINFSLNIRHEEVNGELIATHVEIMKFPW